jgi:hypothetical protein
LPLPTHRSTDPGILESSQEEGNDGSRLLPADAIVDKTQDAAPSRSYADVHLHSLVRAWGYQHCYLDVPERLAQDRREELTKAWLIPLDSDEDDFFRLCSNPGADGLGEVVGSIDCRRNNADVAGM